jgi:hypothetical protein
MGNVPSLRRGRTRRDLMSDDEQIAAYLRSVRSYLHVRRDQRSRVLEEVENHLIDGTAAYMQNGATRSEATRRVIEELGPPETAADAFTEERPPVRRITGPQRWLPMLVPMIPLMFSVALGLWSLTWLAGGLTLGERLGLWAYLRQSVIAAALLGAIYLAIRRADTDPSWRWAAWLGTPLSLLIFW